ncbi:MAG: polysaccharide biosynthesis C-terminal domain-containing protein, partial [Fusobacteriaceae bacterium]
AVLNVGLNYVLIKNYGIKGAALSTLLSYVLSVGIMAAICCKYNLLKLKFRFVLIAILLLLGIVYDFNIYSNKIYIYLPIIIIILTLYYKDFNLKDVKK